MSLRALLPSQTIPAPPDETVVLDFGHEDADEVFEVLSSSTARKILAAIYERPRPASALARDLDLTIQNVNYHINNLRDANLIEVGDTWYSEKGNEMNVYAPTARAVMVVADRSTSDRIRDLVSRAFVLIALLGVVSILFRTLLVEAFGVDPAAETRVADQPMVATDDAVPTAEPGLIATILTDPGVVFFLGGITILLIVLLVWAVYQRRGSPRAT